MGETANGETVGGRRCQRKEYFLLRDQFHRRRNVLGSAGGIRGLAKNHFQGENEFHCKNGIWIPVVSLEGLS
jgi:hypothetical protein